MQSFSQAKPLEMALCSLLIQKQYGFSDEELVKLLRENPYYQYFIGMSGYEDKYPFVPSLLVEFRKRLSEEILNEVNEIIISSEMFVRLILMFCVTDLELWGYCGETM